MRIAVGLSGGVDSSVAAALLREQGHDVVGITMRVFAPASAGLDGARHACYGPDEAADVEDARRVADAVGIPFREFDLVHEYRDHVLAYFRREYAAGRTPNPCMVCNRQLKFGFLLERARSDGLQFDRFATGHYARVDASRERPALLRGTDVRKDQSYFLAFLKPAQLARTVLPLGAMTKAEVRGHARRLHLPVAEKAESQDFVSGDHLALLEDAGGPGPIVDREGRKVGEHRGIARFTVGQRRGLHVASGAPLYVLGIDAPRNAVVVGPREATAAKALEASQMNWIAFDEPPPGLRAEAKIRYGHKGAPARVESSGDRVRVVFDEPQFAVAPGQALVLYDGERVLGGGVIDRAVE